MLRTIEYTFGADGTVPHSPQFAGVQGENGATELVFTPTEEFAEALAELSETYDTVYYRFDFTDSAGRNIIGEATEYESGAVSTVLTAEQTTAGGTAKCCLVFTGENNEATLGSGLFAFPTELYFKDFPLRMNLTERGELNHAVGQVKQLRDEAYDLLASAEECTRELTEAFSDLETANGQIQTASENTASYAATALTNAVTAAGHAEQAQQSASSAAGYANAAQQSAAAAAAAATEIGSTVGNINAILAAMVDVS